MADNVVYGVDFQRGRVLTIDEQDVLRQAVVPEDTSPCDMPPPEYSAPDQDSA